MAHHNEGSGIVLRNFGNPSEDFAMRFQLKLIGFPMSKVTVIAIITAKEGSESVVKNGLSGLVAPTLEEKGCINYDLHVDNEDPRIFAFHETWESGEDLDRHLESAHIKAFQKTGETHVENVQMHRMTAC